MENKRRKGGGAPRGNSGRLSCIHGKAHCGKWGCRISPSSLPRCPSSPIPGSAFICIGRTSAALQFSGPGFPQLHADGLVTSVVRRTASALQSAAFIVVLEGLAREQLGTAQAQLRLIQVSLRA